MSAIAEVSEVAEVAVAEVVEVAVAEVVEVAQTKQVQRLIKLVPSDFKEGDDEFVVSFDNARKSVMLREALDSEDSEESEESVIPLPTVNTASLKHIVAFLEHEDVVPEMAKPLKSTKMSELGLPTWYVDFMEKMTNDEVLELAKTANYMDISSLLELCCARVATRIKGKTPDEIRKEFNIKEDEEGEKDSVKADAAQIEKVTS